MQPELPIAENTGRHLRPRARSNPPLNRRHRNDSSASPIPTWTKTRRLAATDLSQPKVATHATHGPRATQPYLLSETSAALQHFPRATRESVHGCPLTFTAVRHRRVLQCCTVSRGRGRHQCVATQRLRTRVACVACVGKAGALMSSPRPPKGGLPTTQRLAV